MAVLATLFAIYSKKTVRQPTTAGIALAGITALYGIMMFASSYVEEEQHFWYWVTSAWLSSLYFTRPISPESETSPQIPDLRAAIATFVLLAAHRLMTRWNQTGQKFAGAPDIAHDYFPAHHIILWVLILTTYIHISIRFARRTFSNLASPELAVMTALSLTLPSLMFKLNFTQADAPELVQGLAKDFREFTAQWDLVLQARATFMGIAIAFVAIVLLMWLRGKWIGEEDKARGKPVPRRSYGSELTQLYSHIPSSASARSSHHLSHYADSRTKYSSFPGVRDSAPVALHSALASYTLGRGPDALRQSSSNQGLNHVVFEPEIDSLIRASRSTATAHTTDPPRNHNNSPSNARILLRARRQQRNLKYRPQQCLQWRLRLQHPRSRHPTLLFQLGRPTLVESCGCAAHPTPPRRRNRGGR